MDLDDEALIRLGETAGNLIARPRRQPAKRTKGDHEEESNSTSNLANVVKLLTALTLRQEVATSDSFILLTQLAPAGLMPLLY